MLTHNLIQKLLRTNIHTVTNPKQINNQNIFQSCASFVTNTKAKRFGTGCTGAGLGNVKDQMIPTKEHLFRHTKRPRTVSIIG